MWDVRKCLEIQLGSGNIAVKTIAWPDSHTVRQTSKCLFVYKIIMNNDISKGFLWFSFMLVF